MEYQIKFGAIQLISKHMAAPPKEEHAQTEYGFNFSVGINASSEKRMATVITAIAIVSNKDGSELARFQTVMVFEFQNFENIFQLIDGEKYEMPEDLEILLKSAGLSTTRGIIYSEVRGTYLHEAVLPLINIPEIVRGERAKKKEKIEG